MSFALVALLACPSAPRTDDGLVLPEGCPAVEDSVCYSISLDVRRAGDLAEAHERARLAAAELELVTGRLLSCHEGAADEIFELRGLVDAAEARAGTAKAIADRALADRDVAEKRAASAAPILPGWAWVILGASVGVVAWEVAR